jgi:dolichol-phosphate mannosyltransferase
MKYSDIPFTCSGRSLAIFLLCIGIDVTIFLSLFKQQDLLAFAHISSFLSATAFGIASLSYFEPQIISFKKIGVLVLISALVLFLHGGILGTLIEVLNIPVFLAILISAVFCIPTLFLTLELSQNALSSNKICLAAVTYIVMLKLFYLGIPELLFEEAYYWNYAQHLAIGYLDHPLVVAWTIKIFTVLLGNNEFAVRIGAFIYWFVTAFFTFKLTSEIFNKRIAYHALLLVALLPAFFSFGFFMSPDAPLTACWSASIYYIYQALIREQSKAWIYFGISLGVGMSSKYTILLLAIAIFLFMLFDKQGRKWFLRPQPYVAAVIALALFSPVIIWNIQHDWLSFTFQSTGRLENGHHFSLPRFISNLLIILTPIGIMSVIAVISSSQSILIRCKEISMQFNDRTYWLLIWLSLFPVGIYAILSLVSTSKLNWTGPCWLAMIPFLALLVVQTPKFITPNFLKWNQQAWPATLSIILVVYGAGFHYLGIGFPKVPFPQNTHLLGFQELGREIEGVKNQIEKDTGKKVLVVGMDRNKIASGLAFYRAKYIGQSSNDNPAFDTSSEHLFGDVGLMYELWFPIAAQEGKNMLLVGESAHDLNSQEVISRVENAGEIKSIDAFKFGKPVGRYHYRLIEGYHQP